MTDQQRCRLAYRAHDQCKGCSTPHVLSQSACGMLFRYKHEIRAEDKAALHKLMKRQYHYLVTPEVHRELEASR